MHKSARRHLSTVTLSLGLILSGAGGAVAPATPAAADQAVVCKNRGGLLYVIDDDAPIRTGYYGYERAVDRANRGDRLNYDKECINRHGHVWFHANHNPRFEKGWISEKWVREI